MDRDVAAAPSKCPATLEPIEWMEDSVINTSVKIQIFIVIQIHQHFHRLDHPTSRMLEGGGEGREKDDKREDEEKGENEGEDEDKEEDKESV